MRHAAITLAATLVSTQLAHADTTAQDLDKYRSSRRRLTTEFVSVGSARGQSQPAPERMDNIGLMKWGEGTIALGFYLGMLATEHYILSNPSLFPGAATTSTDINATRDELYYALLALVRSRPADVTSPSTRDGVGRSGTLRASQRGTRNLRAGRARG